jgi:Flp pilus assembly pilin Flp
MQRMLTMMRRLRQVEGQDLVEYALLVSLVVVACMVAIGSVGNTVSQTLWRFIAETPI